eukprot:COSAG02_NODE_60_length_43475_cov_59.494582_18_plen_369_part_00
MKKTHRFLKMGRFAWALVATVALGCVGPRLLDAVTVETWGTTFPGGTWMTIPNATRAALEASAGITHLAGNGGAFAVITAEHQAFAWGRSDYGGSIPNATRVAIEAAGPIAWLEVASCWNALHGYEAFTVVTAAGGCFSWGKEVVEVFEDRWRLQDRGDIEAPGSSSAACSNALANHATRPPTFAVASGPCTVTDGGACFRSPNYRASCPERCPQIGGYKCGTGGYSEPCPSGCIDRQCGLRGHPNCPDCFYGPDDDCTIVVSGAGWAHATAFETGTAWDHLSIDGIRYSRNGGALYRRGARVPVSEGTEITWHSDFSQNQGMTRRGFEVCGTLAPQQDIADVAQDCADDATFVDGGGTACSGYKVCV